MLSELVVENLGVIDRAEITLGPGSSSLTGETGAGKTLLVAALELLSGGRADRAKVRRGATEARIDGRFLVSGDHPAASVVAAAGLSADGDGELVVSRTISSDGRGRARVNGHPVTMSLLTELGDRLVEIAGQHEHLALGAPAVQRALVDSFAGPRAVKLAGDVAAAVRDLKAARGRLEELAEGTRQRARDIDVLAFEIAEIEGADVRPGESQELGRLLGRLEHAEGLARGLTDSRAALKGDGGAIESVTRAAAALDALVGADEELGPLAHRLEVAAIEIGDVADELNRFEVAPDPEALEEGRERLQTLARLRRKYGDGEEEVLAHLTRARAALEELQSQDSSVETIRAEAAAAQQRARTVAAELSETRRSASGELAAKVAELLDELALPGARFEVELEPVELYEGGAESVRFLVAADPGETPRPLTKVASGGELSRICLALRLVGRSDDVGTMVFDEVDAGVGGRAARAVGARLAELATGSGAQVLVVTHLPQVAAATDSHYVVTKSVRQGRAEAEVRKVAGAARVEELSRMLAGMPDSELAREHAQELLEVAGKESG
jgi:DNA repair protein RecN (Recombination protein N)